VNRPAIVRETMALKATVDAILTMQIIAVIVAQKKTAFSGSAVRL